MPAVPFDPAKSVFINCPFDPEYAPLFDAMIFATVCCGFTPRSAIESESVGEPRMDRILHAIFESRYSVHDLSRCTGEGTSNFARFNMPLELGMVLARQFRDPDHEWLLLVPDGQHHLPFVSDLRAYDPATHDGSIKGVVRALMVWLTTRPDALAGVTPSQVLEALPAFDQATKDLFQSWHGRPPWSESVLAAQRVALTIP